MDGLYWSFVDEHREFFGSNPRSKMMLRTLDHIDDERRTRIFGLADRSIDSIPK